MTNRIIPIVQLASPVDATASEVSQIPSHLVEATGELLDTRNRPLRDLRISVTDRCNFRCSYCMPKEIFGADYPYLRHQELLSFEEIERLAQVFVSHGVEKIRLTGGEPLLRKGLENLVEMLSKIKTLSGKPLDLTLTTNGSLLKLKAQALRDAGLTRITVSLDGISDSVFKKMNDVDFSVKEVLENIDAAQKAGFDRIKVNMVVKKGVNDQEILPMARHFKGLGITPRFIEYMDVGNTNGWKMDEVLPSREVVSIIASEFPVAPVEAEYAGEVAQRWKYLDGSGEFGVISSVTQAFCHSCTRARLSMEGKLFLCLFGNKGYDLKSFLRSGNSDLEISNVIQHIWTHRDDHYSEIRNAHGATESGSSKVEMSYIGG